MANKRNKKARRRTKHPPSQLPSLKKIESGCFIDFEGFAGNEHRTSPPPVLIGLFRDGLFQQFVFTADYRWAAEDAGVDHEVVYHPDRDTFLQQLAASAGLSRPLFAYSEHELKVIERIVGHRITRRYRNVRSIVKRWLSRRDDRGAPPESLALSDVSRSMGIRLRSKLPQGGVTSRLREVRGFAASRKKWAEAPPQIKKMWREVLFHNRSDVFAIHEMMHRMRQVSDDR